MVSTNFSYKPKITKNTPLLRPGSIAPEPISIPIKKFFKKSPSYSILRKRIYYVININIVLNKKNKHILNLGDFMDRIKEIPAEGTRSNLIRILKGTGFAVVITLILLLIYSCLLTYTNINEKTMPAVVIIVTALSIFVGSFISSSNIRKNGLTNGALVGLIYILVIYLLSSIISGNFGLSIASVIMIIASIMAGAIGGIIGVNR